MRVVAGGVWRGGFAVLIRSIQADGSDSTGSDRGRGSGVRRFGMIPDREWWRVGLWGVLTKSTTSKSGGSSFWVQRASDLRTTASSCGNNNGIERPGVATQIQIFYN